MYEMREFASDFNQTLESFNSDAVDESALDDELAALEGNSIMQSGETSYLNDVTTVVDEKNTPMQTSASNENVSAPLSERNSLY